MVKVVIVTGSGRSGTSSVAGTLKRLGCRIPQPEVSADEHNPRGYYEPRWTTRFHARWLKAIPVRDVDARPDAAEIAMGTLDDEREALLRDWLVEELSGHPDEEAVVIKETRAYWVYPLWQRVSAAAGAELTSLTMLRHPTAVVRSRDTKHLTGFDRLRRQREIANVAAWMNSVFVTERATRDNPRAFVRYVDLVGDWRTAITRAGDQLGLELGDLSAPHDVDEFISPSLNHAPDTWEGLSVPSALVDLAEATWAAAARLVESPYDTAACAELDRLAEEYDALYAMAAAIASDETAAQVRAAKGMLEERLTRKNERIEKLRAQVRSLRGGTDD
ncbi:hypothetical protein BH11ACT8_BH11ACT8_21870 [soil metagenome]